MKPKSKILEFYEKSKDKFFQPPIIADTPEVREVLRGTKKYPALKRLCEGNEELMFAVLQIFLFLPQARANDKLNQGYHRQKRNEPAKTRRYIERLAKESAKNIGVAKYYLDPSIDEKRLINKAEQWIQYKISRYHNGMDEFDQAIDFVCRLDPKLDYDNLKIKAENLSKEKTKKRLDEIIGQIFESGSPKRKPEPIKSIGFNHLIFVIYEQCNKKTSLSDNAIRDCMAEILNTLKIRNNRGDEYKNKTIQSLISRASPKNI